MKNTDYQIYCDLDGVLVDFEKGVVELGNYWMRWAQDTAIKFDTICLDDFENKHYYNIAKLIKKVYNQFGGWKEEYTFADFESRTKDSRAFRDLVYYIISKDKNWWIELDWISNGRKLWSEIQKHNPIILSSPVGSISAEGKRIWCKNNLGLQGDRVIIVDDKGIKTNKVAILIDDRVKSIKQFEAVGGIGILHVNNNYKNTLEILNNIINII